ncbi:MAG: hypothetical protein CVU61_15600 [Deltaproteobacteria bacterium HGW-Deltaproteobacteria-19]|jgi:hypothetical protein|nr:MAG: hypothetical protein CVU61_15600 [Deltaproteobacteria bacterium HGW-Deltaproteobacteria-19]
MSMDPYEALAQMKISALCLQVCMMSTDIGESVAAQEEFEQIVENFHEMFGDRMAPGQIESARKDVDLFLSILQPILDHHIRERQEGRSRTDKL